MQTERSKDESDIEYFPIHVHKQQSSWRSICRSILIFLSGILIAILFEEWRHYEPWNSVTLHPEHFHSYDDSTWHPPNKSNPTCGILWFYHIPKAGGGSIVAYLEEGLKRHQMKRPYPFFHPPKTREVWQKEHWQNVFREVQEQKEWGWKVIHHHIQVPSICMIQHYQNWYKLENLMRSKGCGIYKMVILREPFTNALSEIGENWIAPSFASSYISQARLSFGWFLKFDRSFINVHRNGNPKKNLEEALSCLATFDSVFYLEDIEKAKDRICDLFGWKRYQGKKKRLHHARDDTKISHKELLELNRTLLARGHWEFYLRATKMYKDSNINIGEELVKIRQLLYPEILWKDYEFVKNKDKKQEKRVLDRGKVGKG